jgi:hypothetical protein
MTYEIEKNVPLAPSRQGAGNKRKYPFSKMDVGDSFYVPRGDVELNALQYRLSAAARAHGVRNGGKFATRREGDGVRVTRVE